tara:strand:+ start:412 stop:2223 length:1812 start_codon:yes stop_codon:yes gene_type:complete
MSQNKTVGTTLASSILHISDALWNSTVREQLSRLVSYIDSVSDVSQISKEIPDSKKQMTIFQKLITKKNDIFQLKKAAIALARIKNEHPEMIPQIYQAASKIHNFKDQRLNFITFTDVDRIWHVPMGNKKMTVNKVHSFVLFLPDYSRVASFETPEDLPNFEEFSFGASKNVQLQGAFGKIKGNAHRHTEKKNNLPKFEDLKFTFRTIHDAKILHDARRLENFCFASTSDSGADSFKTAFYFTTIAQIKKYKSNINYPISLFDVRLQDKTDTITCSRQTQRTIQNKEMDSHIEDFFDITQYDQEQREKDDYVLAIIRWAIDDEIPEILYWKDLGKMDNPQSIDTFYALAYLNSRKKIKLDEFKEQFPEINFDKLNEHTLEKDGYVYFLEYEWDSLHFKHILSGKEISKDFPIGLYFHINHDAKRLYLSKDTSIDFQKIYNCDVHDWKYTPVEGDFIPIETWSYSEQRQFQNIDSHPKYDENNEYLDSPNYEKSETQYNNKLAIFLQNDILPIFEEIKQSLHYDGKCTITAINTCNISFAFEVCNYVTSTIRQVKIKDIKSSSIIQNITTQKINHTSKKLEPVNKAIPIAKIEISLVLDLKLVT